MTASTCSSVLAGRRVRWTRLAARMGYTDSPAKRAAIRAALDRMHWAEPDQLADVVDTPIIRLYVNGLLHGRALAAAAVVRFPESDPAGLHGEPARLIGLQSVTGERWVLLHFGYEAIDLLHDTLTGRPAR